MSSAKAATYSVLTKFTSNNGANPYARLVQGTDGNFYGTTFAGGSALNKGCVFKVTPAGVLTVLVSFTGTNGANPYAGLVQSTTDNDFYGTTYNGGSSSKGTVFKVTSTGILTTLVNFTGTNGANPYAGLVQNPNDDNFYGTTQLGGSSSDGTVFKVTSTGVLTTLFNFNGTKGANPYGSLVVSATDGNFYGTTYNGGSASEGTAFKITSAGALTTLANFITTNGANPSAGLVQGTDNNFYGTTVHGGSSGYGTVFKLTSAGAVTTLVTFTKTNGAFPFAGLVQGSDSDFYGATQLGGSASEGTIFKVSAAGGIGVLTTLFNCSSAFGYNPVGGMVLGKDGNFYGTTENTGGGYGAIYRLNPSALPPYSFASANTIGETNQGFSINGSYLNLNVGVSLNVGNVLTVIHNTSSNPIAGTFTNLPNGGTITGVYYSKTFLFTANYSGNGGNDLTLTVKSATSFSTTYSFPFEANAYGGGPPYPVYPYAGLTQGKDGNFYGSDEDGGGFGVGEGFKVTPAGAWTETYGFRDGPNDPDYGGPLSYNGAIPTAKLCLGQDGNFYGTTSSGSSTGNTEDGTIFQYNPTSGALKTLTNFTGTNGATPIAGLIQGRDDNFYGTTQMGGGSSDGTVFKVTSAGVLNTLVSFNANTGTNPVGGVIQGSDGNFYGTTEKGGTDSVGTIFKVTSAGTLTTLVNLYFIEVNGTILSNGTYPVASLVQGTDGNFYGTTSGGGTHNDGTVFKLALSGSVWTLTTLFNFDGTTHGANPQASLIQGNDGNFYGTTYSGGSSGNGTVFKITPAGALTSLLSFNGDNGANPYSGLVQGTDGNFYGTTSNGGVGYLDGDSSGTIYRF